MKIVNRASDLPSIDNLKIGDVFLYDENLYLRVDVQIDGMEDMCMCLCLDDNIVYDMEGYGVVDALVRAEVRYA